MSYKSVEKGKEYQKKYHREYNKRPEVKERNREYHREYNKKPEVREKFNEYRREYCKRPDVKAKRNAYNKANPEKVIQQRIRTYINFLEKHGYQVIGLEAEA